MCVLDKKLHLRETLKHFKDYFWGGSRLIIFPVENCNLPREQCTHGIRFLSLNILLAWHPIWSKWHVRKKPQLIKYYKLLLFRGQLPLSALMHLLKFPSRYLSML